VTDPRLAPIVRAVIDAAFAGERPGEGELLELVDPAAHRQVHDCVFTGLYREVEHPQQELEGRVYDCRRDVLKQQRLDLAAQISQALERGDQQQARELSLARHDLNRQLAELERQPPTFSAAARP